MQPPFVHGEPDELPHLSFDPIQMPPHPYHPQKHLTTPVDDYLNGHFQQMYLPSGHLPMGHGYPSNPIDNSYEMAQYPQQPMAGPSYSLSQPFLPQQVPSVGNGDFRFAYPMDGDWQGTPDWEEDEFRDGQDIIYGNLEVSRESHSICLTASGF